MSIAQSLSLLDYSYKVLLFNFGPNSSSIILCLTQEIVLEHYLAR